MYFFTSLAVSTSEAVSVYSVVFLSILELLTFVYAVATAVFFAMRSEIFSAIFSTCKSFSFGV